MKPTSDKAAGGLSQRYTLSNDDSY